MAQLRLRQNLLIDVINPVEINKYSKSLLNLKTLFYIEQKEGFQFPKNILEIYNEILEKEDNFLNEIPLLIIEKQYYRKASNINGYVSIYMSNQRELNLEVAELFILLEAYYSKMFLLASLVANYYSIEVKINDKKKDEIFA